MIKTIELIIIVILLSFSFFAGVKYSDLVKKNAQWLFEVQEEKAAMPNLSDLRNVEEIQVLTNGDPKDSQ